MKECETCLVKTTCDQCNRRLSFPYQMCDEFLKRTRKIEGHYHIDNKIICVECYKKTILQNKLILNNTVSKGGTNQIRTILLWNRTTFWECFWKDSETRHCYRQKLRRWKLDFLASFTKSTIRTYRKLWQSILPYFCRITRNSNPSPSTKNSNPPEFCWTRNWV